MRFSLTTTLIVILWASLGLLGFRNGKRTIEIQPPISDLTAAFRRQDDIARQQIRLCELALASKPNTTTLEQAEEKFRATRERSGQLHIDDPQSVAAHSEKFLRRYMKDDKYTANGPVPDVDQLFTPYDGSGNLNYRTRPAMDWAGGQ